MSYVCRNCFGNPGLRRWVTQNSAAFEEDAIPDPCSFCSGDLASKTVAELEELCTYINECLRQEYQDPAEELPYDSAEGGYQGEVLDTRELLESVGLELLSDDSGKLFDEIASCMELEYWASKNHFQLSVVERLEYSWEEYSRVAKTGSVLEFMFGEDPGDPETLPPAELLEWLTESIEEFGLLKFLKPGRKLFRVRMQANDEIYADAEALGPPPAQKASQPNRLNPAGTSMMYCSEQVETALKETVSASGIYAIGEFETLAQILVIDLLDLPDEICFFDLENWHLRNTIRFLRSFASKVSDPLTMEANRDVEYRPTQIVTQHLRRHLRLDDTPIHGIRYASSLYPKGVNMGLFDERIFVCDEPPIRKSGYVTFPERPYLKLIAVSTVTK